jgi:hypothetical protein
MSPFIRAFMFVARAETAFIAYAMIRAIRYRRQGAIDTVMSSVVVVLILMTAAQ